jgi:hypothetical protein
VAATTWRVTAAFWLLAGSPAQYLHLSTPGAVVSSINFLETAEGRHFIYRLV